MLERRGGKTYCYQCKREGGRVRRHYLGAGEAALQAERRLREGRQALQAQSEQASEWELRQAQSLLPLEEFSRLLDQAVSAVLLRHGYHQHARSWRLRRHGRTGQDG